MLNVTPEKIIQWIWEDKIKILLCSSVFAVASVLFALSLPNQYSSKTVVSSNLDESKKLGGSLASLGGLASMAGISLGGGGSFSPEVLEEMLSSNSFLASFIRAQEIEHIVIAAEGFDVEKGDFVFDPDIYDVSAQKWVRTFNYPQQLEPSDIELAAKFKESFGVNFDRKTKLISVTYTSFSPDFASDTLNNLVHFFNQYLKAVDQEDSKRNIQFMKQELAVTNIVEVKIALQQLLEDQYKKLALTQTRDEYALKVLEQPLKPFQKSGPKRAFICIIITLGGGLLSILLFLTIRVTRAS